MKRILALCLAALLMLSGCSMKTLGSDHTAYSDMVYEQPDLEELQQILEESCQIARESYDLDKVLDAIWNYYDAYDAFYTNYNLACIAYYRDLTDEYWQAEYDFCTRVYPDVDAGLEELYHALAQSPIRPQLEGDEYFGADYFDAYEGESVWDEEFLAFFDRESEILEQYYELMSRDADYQVFLDACADELCALLVDLVLLRQEQAAWAGYDSYPEFAYDFYYYRDYTPAQAQSYLEEIRQELTPLYRRVAVSDVWETGDAPCTETETFDYVRRTARAMGGITEEAFNLMDEAGLYDITYGENKYDTGFEVYLTSYYEPYIFIQPTGTRYDCLTFAHEFGHFVNDYACYGTYAGIDVCEVFSQGMEYLSLCYIGDQKLERLKLADCLATYVEQASYASFEYRLYTMAPEDLTVEKVFALYEEICMSYGGDVLQWDRRDLVLVPHFYTEPMYIISYVVSNDAALQLYQLEKDDPGAGLARYEENLTSQEVWFLSFLDYAGLRSPFTPGRLSEVRQTLEDCLE